MLQIGQTLISLQLIRESFCCQPALCLGACCVEGDSGAPLLPDEIEILTADQDNILPFLRPDGRASIAEQGLWVVDVDKEQVTPLISGNECAYTLFENGMAVCGIERAWEAGATSFRKPLSCHLYPIRIKKFRDFEALNYDEWDICKPARKYGAEHSIPVYQFLKDALIRKYGTEWYNELEEAAQALMAQESSI